MCVLQPVSVLSLVQEKSRPLPYSRSISAKTVPLTECTTSGGSFNSKAVKRHQSFHGFQSSESFVYQPSVINQNIPNQYTPRYNSQNFSSQDFQNIPYNQPMPSIFYHLPPSFNQITGNYTVDAIRPRNNVFLPHDRVQSFGNLNQATYNQMIQYPYFYNPFFVRNPFNAPTLNTRVVGRNEAKLEVRKVPPVTESSSAENKSVASPCETIVSIPEKRFGSLETRKHKCYSPTFYSMRCKKHGKKRSIIYALPKKSKAQVTTSPSSKTKNANTGKESLFQNLTDSIQILEQNKSLSDDVPKPAPRCKRHRKNEVVYQNISHALKQNSSVKEESSLENNADSSNASSENLEPKVTVVEAEVHKTKDPESNKPHIKESASNKTDSHTSVNSQKCPDDVNAVNNTSTKDITVSSAASQSVMTSPTVAINPSPIKPSVESPKGALSLQIQARLKLSPASNPVDPPKSPGPAPSTESEHGIDNVSCVPKMPILDTQNKWSTNLTKAKQVCFCFVFCMTVMGRTELNMQ